jgi:predicted aspartyl protease
LDWTHSTETEKEMNMRFTLLLLIAFLGSLAVGGPAAAETAARETIVPFELLDHLILVQCRINHSPETYSFILDTGALTAIDKALADSLNLKQRGQQAKIDTFHVGDCVVDRLFVITAFDLQPLRDSYGIDISGIIGSDLLEDYIATIDYEKQRLTLSTDVKSPAERPKGDNAGYLLKFTKHPLNHAPMIKCTLNDSMEVKAMLDTGQPYALVLPLKELEKTGVLNKSNTIRAKGTTVKWPGTTSPDIYLAHLKSIESNDFRMTDIMTVFAELPPLLSVGLLGGDFLSRYLITLDYAHGEALLVPTTGYQGMNHAFSTGLQLKRNAENQLIVRGVWEKSPADLAGIQVGDRILEFNSKRYTPELQRELILLLNDGKTESIELLIETKAGSRRVLLNKGRLI